MMRGLGFAKKDKKYQTVEGRKALLSAPLLPFDGMNEHGLVLGMAAVPDTEVPSDPEKPNVGSLQIIRLMLDQARTVDEALAIFDRYNITKVGGPNIHYLVADATGKSVLIELKDGKANKIKGKSNWQSATNFYITDCKDPNSRCVRYAKIHRRMNDKQGSLNADETFNLLKNVAQKNTIWSVAYDLQSKSAQIVMDRNFNKRIKVAVDGQGKVVGNTESK